MASPENIVMHLPDEQEQAVREIFQALEDRGFPPQGQTPHISITLSAAMAPQVVEQARKLLPTVLPTEFKRVGTVIFGIKRKQSIAWLLETTPEMMEVARQIDRANPAGRGGEWIPHLTMGLRIPRRMVSDYVKALDELTPPELRYLTVDRAQYRRPGAGEFHPLVEPDPESSACPK